MAPVRRSISLDVTEAQAAEMYQGAKAAMDDRESTVNYSLELIPAMVLENLEATFPTLGDE